MRQRQISFISLYLHAIVLQHIQPQTAALLRESRFRTSFILIIDISVKD